MGSRPNQPIRVSVTVGIMINFDGHFDSDGYGNVRCNQTLNVPCMISVNAAGIGDHGWVLRHGDYCCKYLCIVFFASQMSQSVIV